MVLPSFAGGFDILRAIQKPPPEAGFDGVCGASRAFSLGRVVVLGRGLSIADGGVAGGGP